MNWIGRLALIGAALFLQGCPPPYVVRLYNNTGTDISVHLVDEILIWGESSEIKIKNQTLIIDGEDRKINLTKLFWKNSDRPLLRIIFNNEMYIYYFPLGVVSHTDVLPEKYDVSPTAGPQHNFQIEPDGFIYVVRKGDDFPAKQLKPQPENYPIAPISPQSG